jgi:hypothetical protein
MLHFTFPGCGLKLPCDLAIKYVIVSCMIESKNVVFSTAQPARVLL